MTFITLLAFLFRLISGGLIIEGLIEVINSGFLFLCPLRFKFILDHIGELVVTSCVITFFYLSNANELVAWGRL